MESRHVLLVTYPAQGHINPSLQFAKRLIRLGIPVTFVTTEHAHRRMLSAGGGRPTSGLNFAPFSDGHGDEGYKPGGDAEKYLREMRMQGFRALRDTIAAAAGNGRPVTCLVYTLLLPWAAEVAREFGISHALLWIQPATVLNIYYYYFHGFGGAIADNVSSAGEWTIQMPGVPPLSKRDLPSFMLPTSPEVYRFALPIFKQLLDVLDDEDHPTVLVNTFDKLEADALPAIGKYDLIGIGSLIPSTFLDCKDPADESFGSDLFQKADDEDYIEWLNLQGEGSVVYVSFGSFLRVLPVAMEKIGKGLIACRRPFLWVIRDHNDGDGDELSWLEEVKKVGKIVPWCSQLEVLMHPSLGCFVTHCGWNSTLESISCGVPVVAFPYWTDQGTNAKLIEDVWGTGVRVMRSGDVESGELK